MKKMPIHIKKILPIISSFAFAVGLLLAVWLFNLQARTRFNNFETTFITPQQAVIFWKTTTPTIGYIKYGSSILSRENLGQQTSSEPSEVHAVMLEQIPPEGLFVSLHQQGENMVFFPEVHHIKFDQVESVEGDT